MIFNDKFKFFYSKKIPRDFIHGFGTKEGPNIDFLNYKYKFRANQEHRDNIKILIDKPKHKDNSLGNFDGLITTKKKYLLQVFTADCVPIIFVDPRKKIIGISHQGWKGTLLALAAKMINEFCKLGSRISEIICAIGPSIGACCYSIDKQRQKLFNENFPKYKSDMFEIHDDKVSLNLLRVNYRILSDHGIKEKNIDFFPFCTKCNNHLFYSFRGEGKMLPGEMTSFVMIKNDK